LDRGLTRKVQERKATLPPAHRAYGPAGTLNSELVNAYKDVYEQAKRTFTLLGDSDRAYCLVGGFIKYLKKPARHPAVGYEESKPTNREL